MTSSPFLNSLLYLIGCGLICYLLWWLIDFIGISDPFRKFLRGAVAVAAVVVCIDFLFGLGVMGHHNFLHLR